MEDTKTFLLYLIGLVGLIGASLLFANQGEAPELSPLPATAASTNISPAATPSAASGRDTCTDTAQDLILYYVPDRSSTTAGSDNGLVSISGTIYAADGATPLPGALVIVWREAPLNDYQGLVTLAHTQTSANGRYTFTTVNPTSSHTISVLYWVSYQKRCLFSMSLKIMAGSRLRQPFARDVHPSFPMSAQSPAAPLREAAPMFHGPVDIVLPVPPPVSFRTNLIPPDVAGEPLTISGIVYTADRETPVSGVRVDVWQANPLGFYEGYDYPAPTFNLQGRMRTDATGRYEFTTLKPGPVKLGRDYLPAQIRFKVSYQDQEPLFTRLYFAGDPFLNNIPPSPELTIQLDERIRLTGSVWQGNFDIILPVSRARP